MQFLQKKIGLMFCSFLGTNRLVYMSWTDEDKRPKPEDYAEDVFNLLDECNGTLANMVNEKPEKVSEILAQIKSTIEEKQKKSSDLSDEQKAKLKKLLEMQKDLEKKLKKKEEILDTLKDFVDDFREAFEGIEGEGDDDKNNDIGNWDSNDSLDDDDNLGLLDPLEDDNANDLNPLDLRLKEEESDVMLSEEYSRNREILTQEDIDALLSLLPDSSDDDETDVLDLDDSSVDDNAEYLDSNVFTLLDDDETGDLDSDDSLVDDNEWETEISAENPLLKWTWEDIKEAKNNGTTFVIHAEWDFEGREFFVNLIKEDDKSFELLSESEKEQTLKTDTFTTMQIFYSFVKEFDLRLKEEDDTDDLDSDVFTPLDDDDANDLDSPDFLDDDDADVLDLDDSSVDDNAENLDSNVLTLLDDDETGDWYSDDSLNDDENLNEFLNQASEIIDEIRNKIQDLEAKVENTTNDVAYLVEETTLLFDRFDNLLLELERKNPEEKLKIKIKAYRQERDSYHDRFELIKSECRVDPDNFKKPDIKLTAWLNEAWEVLTVIRDNLGDLRTKVQDSNKAFLDHAGELWDTHEKLTEALSKVKKKKVRIEQILLKFQIRKQREGGDKIVKRWSIEGFTIDQHIQQIEVDLARIKAKETDIENYVDEYEAKVNEMRENAERYAKLNTARGGVWREVKKNIKKWKYTPPFIKNRIKT